MSQTVEQERDQLADENLRLREQAGEMAEEIEQLRADEKWARDELSKLTAEHGRLTAELRAAKGDA